MAVGALSTLAFHPVRARARGPEPRSEVGRPEPVAWLAALSLAGLGRPVGPCPAWEREASSVARSWLRLVDERPSPASWVAASPLLREGISPRAWDDALRAVRAPLGRCLWRKLQSRAVVEGPEGPLRGPYVVIRFESAFERTRGAAETITPVLGPDGRWRVAAYFIG